MERGKRTDEVVVVVVGELGHGGTLAYRNDKGINDL